MELWDVLAVNIKTLEVRLMAESKTEKNAEAIITMAVMRRGVEEEFFTKVNAGEYKNGELVRGLK